MRVAPPPPRLERGSLRDWLMVPRSRNSKRFVHGCRNSLWRCGICDSSVDMPWYRLPMSMCVMIQLYVVVSSHFYPHRMIPPP